MKEILHFSSTKERLKYLSGGFEEIFPVETQPIEAEKVEEEPKEAEKKVEKPAKKASKGKKKAKKVEENGEVQAE